MSLVTSKKMLEDAQRGGYAVGAFNAENMEMVMAIIDAACELNAPVIIQTTPSTVKYAGLDVYLANVRAVAERASVPVAMHLDHGNSFELAVSALHAGYTSVMIDGSHESFEDNIALTQSVVRVAACMGIPVEGELGTVGGKEDDLEAAAGCTLPEEAAEFEKRTGVSSLAVAIGTAHGVYKCTPKLDVERLKEIRKVVSVPLVLHGASGLTDDSIRACIAEGICKVNFATELRIAYTEGVKETIGADDEVFDPKKYGKAAQARVKELVKNRMIVCGCNGKA
ncbi:MAG: class II fructose-bisphosphate aldolase [Clostridia bacterium]|nr:class II fructose-bisphosphate aldolase [Clostridia bacterium]